MRCAKIFEENFCVQKYFREAKIYFAEKYFLRKQNIFFGKIFCEAKYFCENILQAKYFSRKIHFLRAKPNKNKFFVFFFAPSGRKNFHAKKHFLLAKSVFLAGKRKNPRRNFEKRSFSKFPRILFAECNIFPPTLSKKKNK